MTKDERAELLALIDELRAAAWCLEQVPEMDHHVDAVLLVADELQVLAQPIRVVSG